MGAGAAAVLLILAGSLIGGYVGSTGAIQTFVGQEAYEEYPVIFDLDNSSSVCQGVDKEFEIKTKTFVVEKTSSFFLPNARAFCGVSREAVSYSEDYLTFKNAEFVSRWHVALPACSWGPSAKVYLKTTQESNWTILSLSSEGSRPVGKVLAPGEQIIMKWQCSATSWASGEYVNNRVSNIVVDKIVAGEEALSPVLYFREEQIESFAITYAVPRTDIPSDLHYRTYSCPLPEGYMMTAETFQAGDAVSRYSFRYPPVFFCERHPVLVTDALTAASENRIDIYKNLVAGQTMTVPEGQTWTLFYIIKINSQLPIVCEVNDTYYNQDTGKCEKIVTGFTYVCSVGQFDPDRGLCTVQGSVETVCELGRYDVSLGKCIWNPPVQALCPDPLTQDYNVDKGVCEYTPDVEAVCQTGYYNEVSGLCEVYPEKSVICPYENSAYDPQTDTCVYTPPVENVCEKGIYNPDTGFCEITAEEVNICERGFFNPMTGVCEYYPPEEKICTSGVYDSSLDRCVVVPNLYYLCPEGIWDQEKNACVSEGRVEIVCTEGTYDPDTQTCKVNPLVWHVCTIGVYNENSGMCEYYPEEKTVCTYGVYEPISQKCIYEPPVETVCPEGSTFNAETGLCRAEPDVEHYCAAGYYDPSVDKCIVNPPRAILCEQGIYDAVLGVCVYTPPVQNQCQWGVYDASIGKCRVTADIVCSKGYWDSYKNRCIYNPQSEIDCIEGVYDSSLGVCVVHPEIRKICVEGVWSEERGSCIVNAEVKTVCPKGVYDEESGVCVFYPDVQEQALGDIWFILGGAFAGGFIAFVLVGAGVLIGRR